MIRPPAASGDSAKKAESTLRRLERIADIPTLPAVLVQVWDLSTREETSAADLGRAMSADPGLTGAILRLANSAYFGFPRKIGTVTQAIVVLGFETVKSLAMGASVFRAIRPGADAGLDPTDFFRHSLTAALGARMVMERHAPRSAGDAFSAGILHDLGRLVMAEFLTGSRAAVQALVAEGSEPEAAEREVLGLDHAGIGAWFANRWSFPEELSAAIRWHHEPEAAESHRAIVAAAHLGDVIAHRVGAGGSGRPGPPDPSPSAFATVRLDDAGFEAMIDRARELRVDPEAVAVTLGT
jgi:HD-like signal output (HDOD) protein